MNTTEIFELSQKDSLMNLDGMMLKFLEECGELAEAVNHSQGRLPHKIMKEPLIGEIADVIITAIAVLHKAHPDAPFEHLAQQLSNQIDKKSYKWHLILENRK